MTRLHMVKMVLHMVKMVQAEWQLAALVTALLLSYLVSAQLETQRS